MNIVIVGGAFLPVPPIAGGAVEKLWFDLGREFARRGLQVTHISRRYPGLPERGTIDGVDHRRIAGFDFPASRVLSKLMDLVYSVRCMFALPRSDIVVTNTFFLPLLLSLFGRRGRVVYVSVHRYPQGQMRFYGKVDRLQCVSTAIADAVREQAPAVTPLVKVVPNYVARWREAGEVADGWAARSKDILFVGRVHPEKGIDLLMRAFAAMPRAVRDPWRLVVVGPHAVASGGFGEAYLQSLKQMAGELELEVQWCGPIFDRAELDRVYARARIFVYPSTAARGEAFPLAPLEAMAQGCPVVTSDLRCFDDYVEPGRNGDAFAIGNDDPAPRLSVVLASLAADDDRQRRYSAAGIATAQRFTLARVADVFIDDFSQLQHR